MNNTVTEKIDDKMICKYVALRNGQACKSKSATEYGFCKQHSTTIQGKNAYKAYELSKQDKPEQKIAEVVKVEQKIPEVVKKVEASKKEVQSPKETQAQPKEVQVKLASAPETKKDKREVVKREIYVNSYGNFEDPQTHIVFNPKTKQACAVQGKNGKLYPLSDKEIVICQCRGWAYTKPKVQENETDSEEEKEEEEEEGEEEDTSTSDDDEEEEEGEEEQEEEQEEEDSEEDEEEDEDEEDEDDDSDDE